MRKITLPARHNDQRVQGTPERLINAVERLLDQRDDLEPSLREITATAGVNIAAVNYHFGSKDALVTAVIERALTENARQQLMALQAVDANPKSDIEDVVRAWISPPVLATSDRTTLIPRIAARVISGGSHELREVSTRTHAETYTLVFKLLADRLPALSTQELVFRITLTSVAVAGMIVGAFDRSTVAGNPPVPRDENTLDRAVSFVVAGLSAPPTRPSSTPRTRPST